jgi:hypothetical protein
VTDNKAHDDHDTPMRETSALLPIPDGSMVPGTVARSTRAEYDSYFQLARTSPDLAQWSQSCISVLRSERAGMRETELPEPDQLRILEGTIVVLEIIIENWIQAATARSELGIVNAVKE